MLTSLPNLLTLSRIVVIPLFVAAFYLPYPGANWCAFGLFLLAGITDYFDGYLARRWQMTSALGRFLDPIADKLLVSAAIVMLVWAEHAPILPCLVILCREILVSGLREFLAELNVSVPVSRLAKWKTGVQIVALCFLLVGDAGPVLIPPSSDPLFIGTILLWIAAVLTLVTGYSYLRVGLRHMLAEPTTPGAKSPTGASGGVGEVR